MAISETQKEQQTALHNRLWAIANDLRGNMEANEFKNYILGLIFYRYLSEKIEDRATALLKEDNVTYSQAWQDDEFKEALSEELIQQVGYVIEPQYLYSSIIKAIEDNTFDVEMLSTAIKNITNSTIEAESEEEFINLFDDMDLSSNKLGKTVKDRTAPIRKVISNISEIDFHFNDTEIDVLGDAYEYLIGQFAANAGKKAGEFYTPQQVSKLLAKIVTLGKDKLKSVYDPTCGSGSLLLRVAKELQTNDSIGVYHFYGQELTSTTYNLARINMLLHNVPYKIRNFQ